MGGAVGVGLDRQAVVPDALAGGLGGGKSVQDLTLEGLLAVPDLGVQAGDDPPEINALKVRFIYSHLKSAEFCVKC